MLTSTFGGMIRDVLCSVRVRVRVRVRSGVRAGYQGSNGRLLFTNVPPYLAYIDLGLGMVSCCV